MNKIVNLFVAKIGKLHLRVYYKTMEILLYTYDNYNYTTI